MNRFAFRVRLAALSAALVVAGAAPGVEIPLRAWEVPSSAVVALADLTGPGAFIPVTPCRIADTRAGFGFSGAYGPPAIGAGTSRTFDITASGCTGIPPNASAYSFNLTVTNTAGPGFLQAYPAGGSAGSSSAVNYSGAGQTIANAAIVPAGGGLGLGAITITAGVSTTDLIIDINGYFTNFVNSGAGFIISGSFGGNGAIGGFNFSNNNGSHGVGGGAAGTGRIFGVRGEIGPLGAAGSSGVYGIGPNTGRLTYGVLGESATTVNDAAGVLGRATGDFPSSFSNIASVAGVRGEGASRGVLGIAGPSGTGVRGISMNAAGNSLQSAGSLGLDTTYGVFASGNMGATGTKPFVDPHPYRAGMVIRYVALEGPEAGTYFRGRGVFVKGTAVIEVPESFRLVTDEEGLTVQVTPLGRAAAVGVTRLGLDSIAVESTRDGEFSYLVQGVRKTFKDWEVVVEGDEFRPESASSTIPGYLSERQKRSLIESGVYNEDGTVNAKTARRLGWDRVWAEQGTASTAR
ncbi:MAG: hypothetical protein IPN83_03280 [Holophagales bacterium]|nr:hypothetical protein [Holophagales bacterium]